MIAAVRGRVLSIDNDEVVVEAGGVGYQVFCHLRTLAALHGERDRDVLLHIHTSVSADAIRLFGFLSREELHLFRRLISVERIGPKAALGILGRAEIPTLVSAIRSGDAAFVATVPGIGRKTAERVILELGDKLDALAWPNDRTAQVAPGGQAAGAAVAGLIGLGFRESEAQAAVSAAVTEVGADAAMGALISASLRRLDTVPV